MENDNLKTTEDQMEIIMMMQQMEKIPEFCTTYNDLSPPSDFSSSSNMSTNDPHCLENLQAASESSPPFMHLTLPPSTDSPQERQAPPVMAGRAPFPTPSSSSRWRSSLVWGGEKDESQKKERSSSVAAMREMIFRIAVMQPIQIDPESVKPPKRRNVKISTDPQSVAARHRRERISERIRILQRLVPGGTKMDTASMLDEAIHYVKFLKTQVQSLETAAVHTPFPSPPPPPSAAGVGFPLEMSTGTFVSIAKSSPIPHNLQQFGDS